MPASKLSDLQATKTVLKQTEERLQLALAASNMGTWEWNVQTNNLEWSTELKSLFGLKPHTTITYDLYLSLLHPSDRPVLQAAIAQTLKDGQPYQIEHRCVWPDGSIHWLLSRGKALLKNKKATHVIGTTMSIDKRKKAELRLHESEERFRLMADSASVMIWVADPKGSYTYFNKRWLTFTDRTFGQQKGHGWEKSVHPDDLARYKQLTKQAMKEKEPFTVEYRLRRYDDTYRWIVDNGAPRFSAEGEFLGFIGSCIDIEDIKKAQKLETSNAVLKSERRHLLDLNKAKDEFISLASHQLRTPATGVKQYVGMLLEGYGGKLSPQQLLLLQTAYESNERQLAIIDDLLRIAHVDSGKVVLKREKLEINQLLKDIIQEQRNSFKLRQQTIDFSPSGQKVMARADRLRLRMVLENLLDNAGKYSPPNKVVRVTITENPQSVAVAITDEGVGIARKDLSKLFLKFSRINNSLSTLVGGTGIGLYWAKKIIDLHNGEINVKSSQGRGSTFTVTLPKEAK